MTVQTIGARSITARNSSGRDTLEREYLDEYKPQGPAQRHYVERLIDSHWLSLSYARLGNIGQRAMAANHASYDRALIALERLQHATPPDTPPPASKLAVMPAPGSSRVVATRRKTA